MNNHFEITVEEWISGGEGAPEIEGTTGEIAIKVRNSYATELEDRPAKTVRRTVRASAFLLASWLVSNWWRLRWEPFKDLSTTNSNRLDWELSHCLPAAGGGYVWPLLTLASDGEVVSLKCEASGQNDDESQSPVRYLNSFNEVIDPRSFEAGVAGFVEGVLARLNSTGHRTSQLHELWSEVREERSNQDQASRRKLEALLGIDPEDDSRLITRLLQWRHAVGTNALEEIAAACTTQRVEAVLGDADEAASSVATVAEIDNFEKIRQALTRQVPSGNVPWRLGKEAAYALRDAWEFGMKPISTNEIADRLNMSETNLQESHPQVAFSLGVKGSSAGQLKLVLHRRHEEARRFDIARLIGDYFVIESDDRWKPATRSLTARQKFQRAFAAEFLCPSDELAHRYERPTNIDDLDDVTTGIAQEYKVSQQVVLHHLANRGIIPKQWGEGYLGATN